MSQTNVPSVPSATRGSPTTGSSNDPDLVPHLSPASMSKAPASPVVGKTPRKLSVYPSNSSSKPQSSTFSKPAASPALAVPIAPKQPVQSTTPFGEKHVTLSRKRPLSENGSPSSNSSLVPLKAALPAAVASSSPSSPSQELQNPLALPQSRSLSTQSFSAAQHMSTYKKHKSLNAVTPQQSFSSPVSTGLYTATYSDIPVFEMMVNSVAVMRRRNDSSLNATQILKVAGIDKSKRTKILEREILTGKHEKVQGGYGKYQGTWIPYDRGVDLCRQYSVYELLQPLLELDLESADVANTPTKEQAMAARRKSASQYHAQMSFQAHSFNNSIQGSPYQIPLDQSGSESFPGLRAERSDTIISVHPHGLGGSLSEPASVNHGYNYSATTPVRGLSMVEGGSGKYRGAASDNSRLKRPRIEPYNVVTPSRNVSLRLSGSGNKSMDNTVDQHSFGEITPFHSHDRSGHLTEEEEEVPFILDESLIPTSSTPLPPLDKNNTPFFDHSKEVISQIFVELDTPLYSILGYPPPAYRNSIGGSYHPQNFSLDVPIDSKGHTALHWAACLGRISLVRDLIRYGANRLRASYEGESALVRAVLVTNNYDLKSFPKLLDLLYPDLFLIDKTKRSVLHHIALTAGIKDRATASTYYLESLIEWIKVNSKSAMDADFKEGDGTENESKDKEAFEKASRPCLKNFEKSIVNSQDKNGDTALSIAARVGNKAIVDLFLGFGANPYIPNRAGLRPVDFGIKIDGPVDYTISEVNGGSDELSDTNVADGDDVANDVGMATDLAQVDVNKYTKSVLQSLSKTKIAQRKVLDTVRIMLGELQTTFLEELSSKESALQKARLELQNKNIEFAKTDGRFKRLAPALDKLREMRKHAHNFECAVLKEDEKFKAEEERQGRSPQPQQSAKDKDMAIDYDGKFDADEPFRINSIASIYDDAERELAQELGSADMDYAKLKQRARTMLMQKLGAGTLKFVSSREAHANTLASAESVVEVLPLKSLLQARIRAYTQNLDSLASYRQSILDNYTELEPLFRKVVSVCTNVPEDNVDELLNQFVKAVESDPEEVDLTRVAGFLEKVDKQK